MGSERHAGALVTRLRGNGAQGRLVGGKGAWLDRPVRAGFSVPPTVVVTTEAYRRVVEQSGLTSLIHELVTTPAPPPEHHGAARARVDDAFREVRLPPEVDDAISAAAEIGPPGGLLAARSSATAEDLHATSFAGQYRSLLGLRGTTELEHAVRLVWASLWHPGPRTYRRFHGIDEQDLAMAVLVMRQVPAGRAGVAFSVDPGGAAGMVRVEIVEGLGEQLVSGRVTPTVHLVPRDATLSDDLPEAVAALVLRVEHAFGEPQDVEWAQDDDGLWLLQARPITATTQPKDDGFDTPEAGRRRWSTTGIVEMLPGVLPPLRWDVCRLLLEESVRRHEGQVADLPDVLAERDLLRRVRGRAALDADLLDALRVATTGRVGRLGALRRSLAATRARRRAKWEAATACVAAAELAELLPDPRPMEDPNLLALRRRVMDLAGDRLRGGGHDGSPGGRPRPAPRTGVAARLGAACDRPDRRHGGRLAAPRTGGCPGGMRDRAARAPRCGEHLGAGPAVSHDRGGPSGDRTAGHRHRTSRQRCGVRRAHLVGAAAALVAAHPRADRPARDRRSRHRGRCP
jgi:pyruvate,water dikinase